MTGDIFSEAERIKRAKESKLLPKPPTPRKRFLRIRIGRDQGERLKRLQLKATRLEETAKRKERIERAKNRIRTAKQRIRRPHKQLVARSRKTVKRASQTVRGTADAMGDFVDMIVGPQRKRRR